MYSFPRASRNFINRRWLRPRVRIKFTIYNFLVHVRYLKLWSTMFADGIQLKCWIWALPCSLRFSFNFTLRTLIIKTNNCFKNASHDRSTTIVARQTNFFTDKLYSIKTSISELKISVPVVVSHLGIISRSSSLTFKFTSHPRIKTASWAVSSVSVLLSIAME